MTKTRSGSAGRHTTPNKAATPQQKSGRAPPEDGPSSNLDGRIGRGDDTQERSAADAMDPAQEAEQAVQADPQAEAQALAEAEAAQAEAEAVAAAATAAAATAAAAAAAARAKAARAATTHGAQPIEVVIQSLEQTTPPTTFEQVQQEALTRRENEPFEARQEDPAHRQERDRRPERAETMRVPRGEVHTRTHTTTGEREPKDWQGVESRPPSSPPAHDTNDDMEYEKFVKMKHERLRSEYLEYKMTCSIEAQAMRDRAAEARHATEQGALHTTRSTSTISIHDDDDAKDKNTGLDKL